MIGGKVGAIDWFLLHATTVSVDDLASGGLPEPENFGTFFFGSYGCSTHHGDGGIEIVFWIFEMQIEASYWCLLLAV